MSIFSHLRKSRQQAKQHNVKLAEQKKKDDQAVAPYKHVPTHAASDAIACAPPAWREAADRPRVIEHNRRRSAMAAAGYSMNMPSTIAIPPVPRLDTTSYSASLNGDVTPNVNMPRAYSSSNIYSGSGPHEAIYSMPDAAMSQPTSWKGKAANRQSMFIHDASAISSTLVSKDPTPACSSRASNSSHDELETAAVTSYSKSSPTLQAPHIQAQQLQAYHETQKLQQLEQLQRAQQAQKEQYQLQGTQQIQLIQPRPYRPTAAKPFISQIAMSQEAQPKQQTKQPAEPPMFRPGSSSGAHHLHPRSRRNSSDSCDRMAPSTTTATKLNNRDSRPPMSMRGFSGTMQPIKVAPPPYNAMPYRPNHQRPDMAYTGFAHKPAMASAATPRSAHTWGNLNLDNLSIPSPDLDLGEERTKQLKGGPAHYRTQMNEHYMARNQQHAGMDSIVSTMELAHTRPSRSELPPSKARDEELVNMFPEPASQHLDSRSRAARGKVASNKGKKNPWLYSTSSPITA